MCAIIYSAVPVLDIPYRPQSTEQMQAGISGFSAVRRNQKQRKELPLERVEAGQAVSAPRWSQGRDTRS